MGTKRIDMATMQDFNVHLDLFLNRWTLKFQNHPANIFWYFSWTIHNDHQVILTGVMTRRDGFCAHRKKFKFTSCICKIFDELNNFFHQHHEILIVEFEMGHGRACYHRRNDYTQESG